MNRSSRNLHPIGGGRASSPRRSISDHRASMDTVCLMPRSDDTGDRRVEKVQENHPSNSFASPVRRRRASLGMGLSSPKDAVSPKEEQSLLATRQKKKNKSFNMKPVVVEGGVVVADEKQQNKTSPTGETTSSKKRDKQRRTVEKKSNMSKSQQQQIQHRSKSSNSNREAGSPAVKHVGCTSLSEHNHNHRQQSLKATLSAAVPVPVPAPTNILNRIAGSRRSSMGATNDQGDFPENDRITTLNTQLNYSIVSNGSNTFDCGSCSDPMVKEDTSSSSNDDDHDDDNDDHKNDTLNNEDDDGVLMASFDDIALRNNFDEIAQREKPKGNNGVILPPKHDTPILRRETLSDVEDDPDDIPKAAAVPTTGARAAPATRTLLRSKSSDCNGDYGQQHQRKASARVLLPMAPLQSPQRALDRSSSALSLASSNSNNNLLVTHQTPRRPPVRTFSAKSDNNDHVFVHSKPRRMPSFRSRRNLHNPHHIRSRSPERTLTRRCSSDDGGRREEDKQHPQLEQMQEESQQQLQEQEPPSSPHRFSSDAPESPRRTPCRFSPDDGTGFQNASPRRVNNPRRAISDRVHQRFHSPRRNQQRRLSSLDITSPNDPNLWATPVGDNRDALARRRVTMTAVRRASNESEPVSNKSHTQSSSSTSSSSATPGKKNTRYWQRPPRKGGRRLGARNRGSKKSEEELTQGMLNQSFNSSLASLDDDDDDGGFLVKTGIGPATPELSRKEWDQCIDREVLAVPASPIKKSTANTNNTSLNFLHERTGNDVPTVPSTADEETVFSEADFAVGPEEPRPPNIYASAKRCEWADVAMECSLNPRDAKYVDPEIGTTALHLAVMSRADPRMLSNTVLQPAPLSVIKLLIITCPEAAIIRCGVKRYTPLCYACLVVNGYDMEDAEQMVGILLQHAPHSALVFSDDGFSALDVHIISYSRLHQNLQDSTVESRSSTRVLRALLDEHRSLVQPRLYGTRMRGPVELLYRCNINAFKEASGADLRRGSSCASVTSTLSDWWAFKWTLMLLRASWSLQNSDDYAPFTAVHAAAQIVTCPGPILQLSFEAFPQQAAQRSPQHRKFNCPLHEVCGWMTDEWVLDGDPFILKRKSNAIGYLLTAFPKAARMTNNLGETPLQLAVETCTPWEQGLGALTKAFGRALLIPRNIERCPEDGPLAKAMAFHADDLGSVGCDEDEWGEDPMECIQGMYPFLVASVLSCVPERKCRSASLHFSDKTSRDQAKSLENKDLESLRSIFGLLRARPQALTMYVEDERSRREAEETEEGTINADEDLSSSYSSVASSVSDNSKGGESRSCASEIDQDESSDSEESVEEIDSECVLSSDEESIDIVSEDD